MRNKKSLEKTKHPMTRMFAAIQEIGWNVLIPFPDRKKDVVYGILVGEDKWVDLVRSYLPDNFDEIVDKKLNPPKEEVKEDVNEQP